MPAQNKCDFIREFSIITHKFLGKVFRFRLSFAEIGITDHLMLRFAEYIQRTNDTSVALYKLTWPVESQYGNDIDLFVQQRNGDYNFYALQAKVMAFNGAFESLKSHDADVTTHQWNKLLRHEATFGSKTFYLLYSGRYARAVLQPTNRDCMGIPSIEELGLSIVETSIVADIRTNRINPTQKFYYRHVFPNHVDSIRKLFCCLNLPPTARQYKSEEISTSAYMKIYYNGDAFDGEELDNDSSPPDNKGLAPLRIVISLK